MAGGASKWKTSVGSPPSLTFLILTVPYVAKALEAPAVHDTPTHARSARSPIRAAAPRVPAAAGRRAPNIDVPPSSTAGITPEPGVNSVRRLAPPPRR